MAGRGFRWSGVGPVAATGLTALALMAPAGLDSARSVTTAAKLLGAEDMADPLNTIALFVGATGMPIPTSIYINQNNDSYIHCYLPDCITQGVATPESLNPITGVKTLTFDQSVAQGAANLNNAISQQLAAGQDHVTVFGFSQGSSVLSAAMVNILNGPADDRPDPDQLSFVLGGDPNNPNGGLLTRLDVLPHSNMTTPSLGVTYGDATPVTEYPTAIYTGEYDAFSDFPKYPINVLAQLNAYLGMAFVHSINQVATPDQIAPASATNPGGAIAVPTSEGYEGATQYFIIPTEHLPLLEPLRVIPGVGPLIADLIGPDLRVLVNLGYGDPDYGWVNENADVPTSIGFLPSVSDFEKVPGALLSGTEQGISQFISDLENPAQLFAPSASPIASLQLLMPWALEAVPQVLAAFHFLPSDESTSDGVLSVVNALGKAASSGYSALLPIADLANALFTTLPAANASIFAAELGEGSLLDAIGMALSFDFAAVPLAVGQALAGSGVQLLVAAGDLINPFVNIQGIAADLMTAFAG